MSTNAPVVIPPTVPYVIITEQPLYTNLYGLNSYPFWFWLVVAGGGFTAVVIIIIGIIICIRKRRTCFWCCCEGFDAESNAPMVGKPPAVKAANHWMAVNDGYVPRAQRLSHGHQQQKFAHIDDLNEIDYDDGRRSAFEWNYLDASPTGPSHWADSFPSCGGANQSPINVISSATKQLPGAKSFTFTNYGRVLTTPQFTLVNNGHTAVVQVNVNDITVSGGGLPSTYTLEQFHLHWGPDNSIGSEHTVDSKSYPLEIHFVHYISALYPNVATAAASGDNNALAVLGVFVDINDANPTPEIANIVDHVNEVRNKGDSSSITPFNVFNLLPQSALSSFFRYSGSLTTPGCSEVVMWTVFTQPLYATSAQLDKLRQLRANVIGDPDVLMTRNYRPVQPVNFRTVYRN